MAEQVRVKIVCPGCGAPLPPEAAARAVECAQCHLTSAPVSVVTAAPNAPNAPSTRAVPLCPRCHTALAAKAVHGVTLQGCGGCGGIFLDNDGSVYVTQRADADLTALADRVSSHGAGRPLDEAATELPCPACGSAMSRARISGIALDVCAPHGTWFDCGELHGVIDAYDQSKKKRAAPEASEVQMAQLREQAWARNVTDERQSDAILAGVGLGVLGLLGALASGSRS